MIFRKKYRTKLNFFRKQEAGPINLDRMIDECSSYKKEYDEEGNVIMKYAG
ncbi:MAG: hypothetical protein JSV92_01980 [archaeon]|nr:MAG: hypothetical protein JSV92_01980 [archaeon]